MLPRTSVNVPWGCINTLLYWIVPLFVSHRNPIRLTRVISSDVSQTEHENKMVTLPCLSPGPLSMRSDALHEHFMIRFKLIWIWMFPCELSSFTTKLETISIIANFSSHVIFFFWCMRIKTEAHTTLHCTYRLCSVLHRSSKCSRNIFLPVIQFAQKSFPVSPGVQHSAFACLCSAIRLHVAIKALGKIEEEKINVCCNTEDQKTVLKVGRDLQAIVVHWISPAPCTHDDSPGSSN